MVIKMLDGNDSILDTESLRSAVYNYGDYVSEFYINEYNNDFIMLFGAILDGELIGGLYLNNNGTIEQLFVKKEYQFSDYHVGTSLMKYIEEHIQDIMDYKNLVINRLLIEPNNDKAEKVYKDLGYRNTSLDGMLSKRVK